MADSEYVSTVYKQAMYAPANENTERRGGCRYAIIPTPTFPCESFYIPPRYL